MPEPTITAETTIEGRVLNVVDQIPGSTLVADATAGDGTLTLDDLFDFDEAGGTVQISDGTTSETIGYSAVDDDTGTLTLTGTLANSYTVEAGTFVSPDPTGLEKVAQIIRSDVDDEMIEARVQHRWYDVLPEGIRDPDGGEAVTAAFDGTDWVVTDILGQTPLIDGSLIDDTTLPPPATSDGDAPSASPAAAVQGGIGSLIVSWTPISNHDPVTYQVYVDTSSGFTPGSGNLVGQTEASMFYVRSLADGTPLDYSTTYYVQIVAADTDGAAAAGAQASGTPAQVNTGDIAVEAITADLILANTITADQLAAVLEIAGTIETATEGQRVVIDTAGVHLYASDGSTIVDIPTDAAKQAAFAGQVDAEALAVGPGAATIQGSDGLQIEPNSQIHLVGGQSNPALAPALSGSYPVALNLNFNVDGKTVTGSRITHYSATGGAGGSTPCYYGTLDTANSDGTRNVYMVEWLASNGHINRSKALITGAAASGAAGFGSCLVGSEIIAVYATGANVLTFKNLALATLNLDSTVASGMGLGSTALDPLVGHVVGVGCDGTNPWLFSYNGSTLLPTRMRVLLTSGQANGSIDSVADFSSSAVKFQSPGNANNLGDSGGPTNVIGAAWDGTHWIVSFSWGDSGGTLIGRVLQQYTQSSGAIVAKQEVFLPFSVGFFGGGILYDGTDYYLAGGTSTTTLRRLKGTSALTWDYTLGSTLYAGYTWQDGSSHHTAISPLGVLDLGSGIAAAPLQRATVIATMPAIPSLATKNLFYALFAGSTPAASTLKLQSASTHASTDTAPTVTFLTWDSSGAVNPDSNTNTFPSGGTPAKIVGDGTGATASWQLDSTGLLVLPRMTTAQRPASPTKAEAQWNEDTGNLEVYDGSAWRGVGPVMVQETFDVATTAANTNGSMTVTISGLRVGDVAVWIGVDSNNPFTFCTDPICTSAGQITLRYHNTDDSSHGFAGHTHTFLILRRG